MKATVYRYNARTRNDRGFNNTGMEKNPNQVAFYATNLKYAENYRFVYTADGDVDYECELETKEVETSNLFNMANDFASLDTYAKHIDSYIGAMKRDYTRFLENATKKSDIALWTAQLEGLKEEENKIIARLQNQEFQTLSDYDLQNDLVAELTAKGYNGYFTNNEIAIF